MEIIKLPKVKKMCNLKRRREIVNNFYDTSGEIMESDE